MTPLHDPRANATPARLPSTNHYPALDGLRGIAVLMVMFLHFVTDVPATLLVDRTVIAVSSFGASGVDLFFVLSGFLITGILYDAKGTSHYFRRFWARRSLRIFPLYFCYLVVRLLILPRVFPASPFFAAPPGSTWGLWTYTVNFQVVFFGAGSIPPWSLHFWTLAVEEQFYLLWPLAVFALDRRALMRLSIGAIVVAALCRAFGIFVLHNAGVASMLMPSRMDTLAVGAIIALAIRDTTDKERLQRVMWPLFVVCTAIVIGVMGYYQLWRPNYPLTEMVAYLPLAVAYGVILLHSVAAPNARLARFMSVAPLRFIGRYSYGLYVLHVPVVVIIRHAFKPGAHMPLVLGSILPAQFALIALLSVLSIALAVASYHVMEVRFLALKRFFPMIEGTAAKAAG